MIQTKLFPWYMAKARKSAVKWSTLPMYFSEQFWKTWVNVMFPEPNKPK